MKPIHFFRDAIIVAFVGAFIITTFKYFNIDPLKNPEGRYIDAVMGSGEREQKGLVVIEMDDSTLKKIGNLIFEPDLWLPRVIDSLSSAKVIGLYLPDMGINDSLLLSVNEYLLLKQKSIEFFFDSSKTAFRTYKKFVLTFYPTANHFKDTLFLEENITSTIEDSIIKFNSAIFPDKRKLREVVWIGYPDLFPDIDGKVRSTPMLVQIGKNKYYTSFSAAIVKRIWNVPNLSAPSGFMIFAGSHKIPVENGFRYRFHVYGNRDSFEHYSFMDLLNGKIGVSAFKDKVVIIGPTVKGIDNGSAVSFSPYLSGVYITANIVKSLIDERVVVFPPLLVLFIFYVFMGFLSAYAVLYPDKKKGIILLVIGVVLYIALSYFSIKGDYLIELIHPIGALLVSFVIGYIHYSIFYTRAINGFKRFLERHYPSEERKRLFHYLSEFPTLTLEDKAVALYVQIDFIQGEKGLTSLVKAMAEISDTIQKSVFKNKGILIYRSAGVMLFLFKGKNCAPRAASTASLVWREFKELNVKLQGEQIGEFLIGVGLSGGPVLFGNGGSLVEPDISAMGQPVQISSQLAITCLEQKTGILLDEEVVNDLPEAKEINLLGELEILSESRNVYELVEL